MTCIHVRPYFAQVFSEKKIFQTEIVDKIKTRILYQYLLFIKSDCLKDNEWNYCRARHATVKNMAHAHCILDTKDYKHSQNMQYLLLFHCNDGCTKVSVCYVVRTRPVLYFSTQSSSFTDPNSYLFNYQKSAPGVKRPKLETTRFYPV
jgi:hypothetical protein